MEVGHVQSVSLPGGRICKATTLALRPLIIRIDDYLTDPECDAIISLARPRMQVLGSFQQHKMSDVHDGVSTAMYQSCQAKHMPMGRC